VVSHLRNPILTEAGLRTTDEVLNVLGGFCVSAHLTPSGYEVFWPDTPTEKQELIWRQLRVPDPGTRVPDVRPASQEADLAQKPTSFSKLRPLTSTYSGTQPTHFTINIAKICLRWVALRPKFGLVRCLSRHTRFAMLKINCYLAVIGTSVVALGLIACLGVRLTMPNRDDYNDTLRHFARALMHNKVEEAESLSSPEQWERINDWTAKREAFYCPFSPDPDDIEILLACKPIVRGETNLLSCNYSYGCVYNEKAYRLSIENVILKQIQEGYQIMEWDEICEDRGEGNVKCD